MAGVSRCPADSRLFYSLRPFDRLCIRKCEQQTLFGRGHSDTRSQALLVARCARGRAHPAVSRFARAARPARLAAPMLHDPPQEPTVERQERVPSPQPSTSLEFG